MKKELKPHSVPPPGFEIAHEIEARGWSQAAFAAIIGRPVRVISEIIIGKKPITPEMALEIGAALGTSAKLWLNWESEYRLFLAEQKVKDLLPAIQRRAQQAS